MKFLYGLGGANVPIIRDFDIYATEVFKKGDVVFRGDDGKVTKNASISSCMGVAAEDHTGKSDILNERSDKTKLRVDITGFGVYACPTIKVTASANGTATNFKGSADGISENLSGGKVILIKKGENSGNTDSVGSVRNITSVNYEGMEAVFNIEKGATVYAGDVYAILPAIGYEGGLGFDGKTFSCSPDTPGVGLKVIGHNEKTAELEVIFTTKIFN